MHDILSMPTKNIGRPLIICSPKSTGFSSVTAVTSTLKAITAIRSSGVVAMAVAAVDKGWVALVSAVDSDGMVHWVQHVGKPPDPVQESDTQLYGVGAFLLVASEITRSQGAETADNVDGLMARF